MTPDGPARLRHPVDGVATFVLNGKWLRLGSPTRRPAGLLLVLPGRLPASYGSAVAPVPDLS